MENYQSLDPNLSSLQRRLHRTIKNKSIHNYTEIDEDFNISADSDRPIEDFPYDSGLPMKIR